MIEITDWSREVVLGARAWVTFRLTRGDGTDAAPLRPVRALTLDARVDGLPGLTIAHRDIDLRWVVGLSMPTTRAGTYSLHVVAEDDLGCRDETQQRRTVIVHPR